MNRVRVSGVGAWLVFFALACSEQSPSSENGPTGDLSATNTSSANATTTAGTTASGVVGTTGVGPGGNTGPGGTGVTGTATGMGATGSTAGPTATGVTGSAAVTGTGGAGATGVTGSTTTTGGTGATTSEPEPTLVTSGDNDYWVEGELTEGGDNPSVTVDEATTYQQWRGFGGTFNEAGWDALGVLDPADRERAIRLLFSDTAGAGFDWGRIPMGASDYALVRYTLAETPNDLTMQDFSIERDRQLLIPYIKAALAIKPDVQLWASPWSPPAWMKDSNQIDGTDEYEGTPATFTSNMLSDPAILEAYALYFARFVEEYAAEGMTIQHVQPQNEPGYATRYPSCLWSPNLMRDFVRDYLGPTFASRNLTTEIWFGTMSAPEDSAHLDALLADSAAASLVKGYGLQWNTMDSTTTLASTGNPVMQTEHKCGNYPWETATFNPNEPPNDHAYGEESWGLIKQWIEAGVHIYSAWNMVLDTQGQNLDVQRPWPQNALLAVDRSTNTLIVTPAYYVFRHLSQFVDPGAVRLGTSGGDALAFKNPDASIVTVLYNSTGQASATSLAVGGTTVQLTIPARGWATVNWQG